MPGQNPQGKLKSINVYAVQRSLRYPRCGFSGGGGTSRKSFFLPENGRTRVGRIVVGRLLGMVGGRLPCAVGDGVLLCALAFKIRRKNENRISAKIPILTHDSIARS
jgi:hypothetical protein